MKTFTRHRTLKELKAFCKKRGWPLETKKYDEGSDFVSFAFEVGGTSGRALFSTFNGRIFGETSEGEHFSSDSTKHEGLPWFDALLEAAYV